MKTKTKKVVKKATKKQSDRLILSFKGYEVNLGPGEATDLIDMMIENWPAKYKENADIARLKELDSRGKLEKTKNVKLKNSTKGKT